MNFTTKGMIPSQTELSESDVVDVDGRAAQSAGHTHTDGGLIERAYFPEQLYLESFPDVAKAVKDGRFPDGYAHYLEYGHEEIRKGRRRRIEAERAEEQSATIELSEIVSDRRFDEVGDAFFPELFAECYPDVAKAAIAKAGDASADISDVLRRSQVVAGNPPAAKFGRAARASETLHQELWASDLEAFDGLAYLLLNPDVLDALGGNADSAKDHWLNHGCAEGRIGPGLPMPPRRSIDLARLFSRPMGINVFGPFETTSGLGTAARAMAKAVKASGIPFDLWMFKNKDSRVLPAAHHAGRKPRYRVNLLLANADLLHHLFAAYPEGHFDDAYNIAVWQWELASFRADWIFSTEGIDEIWTNSRFQRESIGSLVSAPVINIPLPISASSKTFIGLRQFYSIPDDDFVFLCAFDVGSTAERKNPFAVIDAFRRLTTTHEHIHLVLKYHGGMNSSTTLTDLRKALRGVAHVTVISDKLDIEGMDRLRATCDCLISAHRSEGFGLNIAEFMSLGKPVIATMYSGNTDFFNETVGYPIDYRLVEVEDTVGPYRKGFVWADPCPNSILRQMRSVLDDPQTRQSKAEAAAALIRSMLSLEAVGGAIARRLEDLNLIAEPPQFLKTLGATSTTIRSLSQNRTPLKRAPRAMSYQPLMSVVVPVYNVPERYLSACVQSVLDQSYPFWELCLCDDGSTRPETTACLARLRGTDIRIKVVSTNRNSGIATATNRAVEVATGPFVVLLDNDDTLQPNALEEIVAALNQDPHLDVLYTDEDKIDAEGNRIDHFCKPDWSPEHLESVMYVLHMLVIRKALFLKIGGLRGTYDGAQDYDLMLRLSRETDRISHVAKQLYRWRAIPGSAASEVDAKPTALVNGLAALNDHAKIKYGSQAFAEKGLLPGTFRLRRRPVDHVFVSLLILTGNRRMDHPDRGNICLVENFVDSIIAHTTHANYEIVIVDNSTLTSEQIERFRSLGARIENYPHTGGMFNYAAKANFAISRAQRENIVILNDDMEVIRGDWLTSLLELSTDPEIGAVGARLLHADGSVQHAGTVLGVNGGATHIYHGYARDFVGYNGFTHIIRNYSAVTAACLATRRSIVTEIGGFDETFATDYNDVDLCLKIRKAGYRIAYTPYAELYHFESISIRRTEQNPDEVSRFRERWSSVLARDPYYNPNLTRNGLDFAEAT